MPASKRRIRREGRGGSSPWWPALVSRCGGWLLLAVSLTMGCAFSVAPTSSQDNELTLELAAYPSRVSVEDSTATAEVWATVRMGDTPVRDNTVVKFATTVGTITSESQTVDGLAVAILRSPGDNRPRQAEVVAQAITVRDTIEVDFVIIAADGGF